MKVIVYDNEMIENNDNFGKEDIIEITKNKKYSRVSADLMTSCKNYKTAVRRFFKALKEFPELSEWEEDVIESCKSGYFKAMDSLSGTGFEIGQYEDCFYIRLTTEINN